ncbi:SusC/RagA family TonB-linked outer membrane protein [Epilithonimonas hungarica]|uniref:TonB-linked outer membrane protein, SusC/RagA family n=1 Tax=Epilithonimonas hungarica TaxID=454006 RepID=A0A1G7TZR9_9FLAO|nr:TonB-dependent receptor [Epilithonimonas hungarica]SDG40604.1 TonB-linked outer membrane protein, SusC/RagA family [Epilithonimonas hungarica]
MSGLKLGIHSAFIKTTIASVFLLPAFGLAQELIKVSGTITSDQKKIVPNVEVAVKNSKFSTMTDKSGRYELNVPKNATLVIRGKGYEEQEVDVNGQNVINIALAKFDSNKEKTIDEVVLVGYTTVSKKDVTNSIASVKGEQLADMPVNSAAEAIQGRMAGVQVTFGEGSPGSDPEIKVRGGTSITQDNAPLYIVDGIQMDNALSLISPKEIESIEVLKDASSTSIYGARGANGVVLITTKSGRKNVKTTVNYNGYTGVRKIAKTLDVMSPYDFVQYQYELRNKDGYQEQIDKFVELYGNYLPTYDNEGKLIDAGIEKYRTIQTKNWQDEVFGKEAFNYTHNLNITGGNSNSAFTLSLNHVEEDGIMINSGYKRNMANFKYDFDISKKLKVGLTARYSETSILGAGTSTTGSQTTNRLRNIIRYKPFEDGAYAGAGSDEFDSDDYATTNLINPLVLVNNEIKYNNTDNLFLNGVITYNIMKDLTFKSTIGYVKNDQEIQQFSGPSTYLSRINSDMSVAQLTNTQTRRITNTNTLAYKKKIGNHKMDFLLGQEIVQTDGDKLDMTIRWLPTSLSPKQAFANIQLAMPPAGMIQDAPATSMTVGRLASFFARANYIYNNKYIATFSIRRDGSNSFGPSNRWANFPSASLAWKVGEENFLKDSKIVNDLKLRLGYGQSGNDRITPFLFDTFYTPSSTYGYTGGTGIITGSAPGNIMANPNIKWEATVSQNVGVDFTLFNKRVYGALDGYITNTKDLLLLAKIPQTSGYEFQYQNSGKTQNKGLELSLGAIVVSNENFQWKADFNVASNKNIIKSLGPLTNAETDYYLQPSGWVNNLYDFKVQIGAPVGTFYGYVTEGRYEISDFDFNSANNTYKLKEGIPSSGSVALGNKVPQPGDLKLRDLNGDGVIDVKDQTDLGNAQPKFYGGFNQTFRYKNFDMSLFFNFSVGNKVYNANKIEFTTKYQYTDQNMLAEMANRWKWFGADGVKVVNPEALAALNADTTMWTPTGGNYFLHSYAIEDGSFLRLNNVTIGYTLPKDSLKMLGITNFRLYATANNVFTITGYSGYDPEVSTRKSTLTPGVDYAAFPRSRFFLTGVDVTF